MALDAIELLLVAGLVSVYRGFCPMAELDCAVAKQLVVLPLEHCNKLCRHVTRGIVHIEGKGGNCLKKPLYVEALKKQHL